MTAPICVLVGSPRAGGNSECMAQHFVQGVHSVGGQTNTIFLRDRHILPCRACHACHKNMSRQNTISHASCSATPCILAEQDHTKEIFTQINAAPLLFIAAPIFFYHLPAQLKALVDRGQVLWEEKEKNSQNPSYHKPTPRPAFVSLVAARTRGDKLFEGSLLSLRYFLQLFDMQIQETCLMVGYDAPKDFAHDPNACARLHALGVQAQSMLTANIQEDA